MPFNSATLRVCSPRESGNIGKIGESGSKSNPIEISDSEPLGSPSNPIIIHHGNCDSRVHGLPVWPSTDADTESQLSSEAELGGAGGEIAVSTLYETNTSEHNVEHRSHPVAPNAISEGQAVPSDYSNPGQSRIAQLLQGNFQTEDAGRFDLMDNEIMQLGSSSNPIVSRNENDVKSETATDEQDNWFDVDDSQPIKTGEPGLDQVEEIDLTSVHNLYNAQHKKGGISREKQSGVGVNEPQAVKHQTDIGLTEEMDLIYANPSASHPKNTDIFEPISEDVHCLGASSSAFKFDKSGDQTNGASSIFKADDGTISTEPEDGTNTDSSTPGAGPVIPKDNAIISSKRKGKGRLDTAPALREAGFVSIETQKAPPKRNLVFDSFESSASVRRSERVAKRVKF